MDHQPLVVLGRAHHLAVELRLLNGRTPMAAVQQDFDPWHAIVSTVRAQRELGFRPRYPSAWAAMGSGAL